VNYAALLVVLVVLTFAFPAMVRFTRAQGIQQGWAIAATICGAAFVLAWYFIRERVQRDRLTREKIDSIRAQLDQQPDDPEAFFLNGEHIGDLLVKLKRRDEALEIFERYLALEKSQGRALPKLEARLAQLRSARAD
jgi:tetratricopeptide (TPR) repeat protein